MALVRRSIHIVAWVGTVVVLVVSLALIVSQTPWFRDWVRRTIVRETKQYLNGELSIGGVGGNLFYGITLSDVAVDVSGERVIAIKSLAVDYNVFNLVSRGIVLDRIALTAPVIRLSRDANGWNLARLVKRERREADREGPGRAVSLPSIAIVDGSVSIDDLVGSTAYRLPERMDALNVEAGFEYVPVRFSVTLKSLSFNGDGPDFDIRSLSGGIAVRDDNLYLEDLRLRTAATSLDIDGVIETYLRTPVYQLVVTGDASLPELARVLPAVEGFELRPTLSVKMNGPLDGVTMDLDVKSDAGLVRGRIVADFLAPDLRFTGPVAVERLNIGPLLKNPSQKSVITGNAKIDIGIPSAPAGAPALDRLRGSFEFQGPHVVAFGYEARQVRAVGSLDGPRIVLKTARAQAYGGAATTTGTITLASGKRPVAYDLQGSVSGLDLRRLPRGLRVPQLETILAVRDYHVTGSGTVASGAATLGQSTIEGATFGEGTVVEFASGKGPFTYAGRGSVSGMNLPRLGRALRVPALEDPKLDGTVNGAFDVRGSGTSLDGMTLDATGTLTDTTAYGTHLSEMAFAAKIAGRGLTVAAKGNFDAMNPAVIADRRSLDGNVSGSVDATVRIADLSAPITPAALTFDGQVSLAPSLLGGVQIAGADVVGHYEAEVADLQRLQLKGPDVTIDASGRLALDRTSQSNLKFRLDAPDISEAGQLAGQESLDGGILVDGVVTGNAASMQASGTFAGRTLAYANIKALDAKGKYDVVVPDLDFVNATVNATTDATFVEIAGTELNQVTATTTYAKRELAFSTHIEERTRELDAKGRVVFHPDHQEIHLPELAVRTEGIEWTSVPGGDPRVQYRPGELTLDDIRLQSGDQRLEVSGTVAVGAERPAGNLLVNATNVDLAQVERLLLQNRGLQGRLTARATIAGTTSAPVVDGHVEITGGGFQGYKYDSLVADVDYEGRKIALDAKLQQAPGVEFTAKGTVPTSFFERTRAEHIAPTAEDAIDLRFHTASLNLGVLQGLTTAVTDVAGILQADVRVTGSGRDPHFVGFIEIRDGAFAVPRVGTSFGGLDTRIDLEEDVVRLRRFEILDENGEQLVISGQLATHERSVGAVDLTVESSNFEIIDNELGDVGIGTQLKVTGQLSRPRIEGEIRLATGRLEVDRILTLFYDPYRVDTLPAVVSAERTAVSSAGATEATRQALAGAAKPATAPLEPEEKAAPAEGGIFENLAMQVHVRIPDNLVVRGRRLRPGGPTRASIGDINLTIGGDLDVRKEPGDSIRLIGTVNTVRGTYQFQGRQFDLARNGIVRFIGDDKIDPTLDITATRQIPDTGVEARVKVTGTVSAPELQLSSVPPLEESDILALIVFNRSVNDLGTGERASLAATAGGIATGFIATPLGESIGRALDLDLFEISAAAEGDTLGATLTVGDQIGDRTFIKLRQQFGERSYSEFLVEYQIADFLRLAGSLAPETAGTGNRLGQRRIERVGIDLIFFFSY